MSVMTGGLALARQLQREQIRHVFGIPGIQLDHAVEGLRSTEGAVAYVVPRHEQATSYMADGYARAGGPLAIGTMMVVPGPGLLNAMAGLATAHACNARVLCLVGQIHSGSIDKGLGLLHELPSQDGVLATVTKWTARAQSPAQIPQLIREAVSRLRSGAPKPVAIELPHDVLSASQDIELVQPPDPAQELQAGRLVPPEEALQQAAQLLASARLPVIYAGGGVLASGAAQSLRALAECLQAPVVMSDNGRGSLSSDHPLALNTLGGRAVFRHADVVLVVGSRFIDGMAPVPSWPADKVRYAFLNTNAPDMAAPRQASVAVQGDAQLGLARLAQLLQGRATANRTALAQRARAWAQSQIATIQPQAAWVEALADSVGDGDIVVHEMTQVGYLARLAYPVKEPGGYLTPGYQGTLGFGFPTALGAAFARPRNRVISLNGDGGFGWNLQELSTAAKYRLNVAILVFVDGYFGNVRTIQRALFGQSIGVDLHNPDYRLLARAMGVPYHRSDSPEALRRTLHSTAGTAGPIFIEVRVAQMPSPWHLFKLMPPQVAGAPRHDEPPDPILGTAETR